MRCKFIIKDITKPNIKTCSVCGRELNTNTSVERLRANCKTPENETIKESAGLVAKAVNFGKAIVQAVKDGELCTQEQIDERLKICRSCEHLIIKVEEPFKGECSKCGCGCSAKISLMNKLAHKKQHCPLDKWQIV